MLPQDTFQPTIRSIEFTRTDVLDSIRKSLSAKQSAKSELKLFYYAITLAGWKQIQIHIRKWLRHNIHRSVIIYVGVDHGITEPDAIKEMMKDNIQVRVMKDYTGTFHPKVIWLKNSNSQIIWVGSNNLTKGAFLSNIEFGIKLKISKLPNQFKQWCDVVEGSSVVFSEVLLKNYESSRRRYLKRKVTYTWKKRTNPPILSTANLANSMILEIMPRETGSDGNQIQIPIAAAQAFFKSNTISRSSRLIKVKEFSDTQYRTLTLTINPNRTARLVINELDYLDRPCLIVFQRKSKDHYTFEIVQQSVYPTDYKRLLRICDQNTRRGSRRWCVI